MKYVIMIHSHPRPWGHPTSDYLSEYQSLTRAERDRLNADFEKFLGELHEKGELISGEALGAPESSRLYRWSDGKPLATDGPYADSGEHLAGFFLIEVDGRARAEEIAARFAGPGETVELRSVM
ncbi:hypothetical protein BJY24_002770 [Nocardia transvalensis]|uniref:YCII-related domain-containing protein n=1 Tax=Nocardia transvalensis TaxID=37333 RepID=A0A7W9PDX6_9NOCA|nr:YciI family protein [Nocardia transvalensis]MBB5913903.1 hypothetical protein [Nocardia transvalensis]